MTERIYSTCTRHLGKALSYFTDANGWVTVQVQGLVRDGRFVCGCGKPADWLLTRPGEPDGERPAGRR